MTRFFLFLLLCSTTEAAAIQRIWLSFQRAEPTHLTVNWETAQPATSRVTFGINIETPITLPRKVGKLDVSAGQVFSDELVTLHHLEIPIPKKTSYMTTRCSQAMRNPPSITSKPCPPKNSASLL